MSTLYRSTSGAVHGVSLGDALLAGIAPDGGLFMPESIPRFRPDELLALRGRSYPDVAHAVLSRYTEGLLDSDALLRLCHDAYDFAVPLEPVGPHHVLRLDRGPTASFKDFAARMMGRLLGRLVAARGGELCILTATSGDTGSAVAHAFHKLDGIRVVVLFPVAEVSDRQRKQMTTLGGNITTVAVDGKFDDCQALVKRAFADPALASLSLSSANSINIGRLLPQSVYYLYAWLQLADVAAMQPAIFSVPCGNFGNLVGGMLAQRMGLPVRRWVVSTNANDEVPRYLRSGSYHKLEPSRECLSNAMNVGHPSNLARLVELFGGQMSPAGDILRPPDLDALRGQLWATSVSDADTRATVAQVYADHGALLEPHGAVAWAGLQRYLAHDPEALALSTPTISLETAHPAKFPEVVRAQTGVEPALPPSLQGLDDTPEHVEALGVDYEGFAQWLAAL